MAAAPPSFQEQIHEELTCSICLELFTRPKVLPCQHTFCQDCLQDHAEVRIPFHCPNCRQKIKLPPQGVAGFPDSHIVANMCERLKEQETLPGEITESHQSENRCSFHPSEEVKLYCKQCTMPVCTECCEEGHDGHPTTGLKKAAQERRSIVQALINEGGNILESYCSFIRGLRETEKNLNEEKQQIDNRITQAYYTLLAKVEQNHRKNLDRVQTERDRVLADVNELSAACDQAKQKMEHGGVEFLSQETLLTAVVGKYRGKAAPTPLQIKPAVFQPTDTPVSILGNVTVQSFPSAPKPAAPTSSDGTGHHHGNQAQEVNSLPSIPIPAAHTPGNNAAGGTGHHHGNQREEKRQPQRMTFGRRGSETGQFNQPQGVTVSEEGEVFIADSYNHRIQVFTLQGTFVSQFPTYIYPKYCCFCFFNSSAKIKPMDITMDGEGNLWVVGRLSVSTDFAVQYNKQGEMLRKFELMGTGFIKKVAVATKSNHILITQTTGEWPHFLGVLVFRPNGTFVRSFGWQQLKIPGYITVDKEGRILVSDRENKSINVYAENGQFLFKFGGGVSFRDLFGICTDTRSGNIFVVDSRNGRVQMFDKGGKFLKHIATGMKKPQAVAMATQGQLVVTDCINHTVTILHNW
ncbi:TRIM3 [Branchiostoma lanceolatum]|uniref:RING-type E3 ubiquitin transferase n=1 Tax=Branchiostoma lanceolatum TaxID=7740 RepID=A0A8J9YMP9_BRALA|nr:TRIM3 [Branchiostoma lanceolatum]